MKNALLLIAMVACNQNSAPKVPEPSLCIPQAPGERGDAIVEFEALKNGDTPTFGTIRGRGSLTGETLVVDFDPSTIDTGVLIRDQRLGAILFKVNNFPLAVLTANLANDASGKQKLSGQLVMAGQSVHFEGYGEIIVRDGSTILRSTSEPSQLNLALSPELVSNLYELMALAGVQDIGKTIKLTGEVVLARDCDS